MVRRDVEAGGRRRKSRDALTSRPEIERLLEAARTPASPRELAGEHAAVDLFARARLVPAAVAAETPPRSPRTGLKAAAASAVAVAAMSSGVAFATTGHVPFADTMKQVTRQVTGQGSDDRTEASNARQSDESESSGPQGPKAAALPGLCRAYAHGQKATHGQALEARPFAGLVKAAGGAEQVADFCASLSPTPGDESGHPSHPSRPTQPTAPTTHPAVPATPSEPGESHATTPVRPSKPTQASEPTRPPTPSHASEPTVKPSHAS